jgi:hypothetical protein
MAIPSWLPRLPSLFCRAPATTIGWSHRGRTRQPCLYLEILEARTVPALVSWLNPLGGDWDNPLNWSSLAVPGINDQVYITTVLPGFKVSHMLNVADSVQGLFAAQPIDLSAGSLSLANSSSLDALTLDGGTLTGPGNVTLNGLFNWSSGTLSSSGQVNALGGIFINGAGLMLLDGATLNNYGLVNWTTGDVNTANSATFNNQVGAIFYAKSSGAFYPTFYNFGTVRVLGSATTTIDSLYNVGLVKLVSGSLNSTNYRQDFGLTDLGGNTLNAANVIWTGGTLSGTAGQLNSNSSLFIDAAAPLNLDGITVDNGGMAIWNAGDIGTVTGSSFKNLAGATFVAQSDATFHTTFANAGAFLLNGSAVTNLDTLLNSGGVTLQTGTLNVTNYQQSAGFTNLGGGNTFDATNLTWTGGAFFNGGQVNALGTLVINGLSPLFLDSTSLNNLGTASWTSGDIGTFGGSTFNNFSGATFTAKSDANFYTTFNNAGTFRLQGIAVSYIDTLNNSGILTLISGNLYLGAYDQIAGVANLGGHTITAGNVDWSGGTITDGGKLNALYSLLIDGTGPKSLDSTINNFGSAAWIAGNIGTVNSGTFNNQASATFAATSDATFHTTFNNAGAFTLAGSATTTIDTLNNTGTVGLQSGVLNTTNYVQTGGNTYLQGNTLADANPVWIADGGLWGPGTINGNLINGGLMNTGGIGVVVVNGNYSQTPTGSLWLAIGGANLSQIDQLQIAGTASLQGSLNVRFINGATPGPLDSYPVVTAGMVASQFDGVTIANPSSTVSLQVVYSPNAVSIAAVPALPPPADTGASGTTSSSLDLTLAQISREVGFGLSSSLADQSSDELIRRLAIGRSGGGGGPTSGETGQAESIVKSEQSFLAMDLRRGGGAGMDESGADDDLVAALLASLGDFDQGMDSELLSGFDIATSLLTGVRPKADILPQKGSRLASVATLVSGEASDEAMAQQGSGSDDELPLQDLLIDPVRKSLPSAPAESTPGSGAVGEQGAAGDPARWQVDVAEAYRPSWAPLFLGFTAVATGLAVTYRRKARRRRIEILTPAKR